METPPPSEHDPGAGSPPSSSETGGSLEFSVNGEPHKAPAPLSVAALLERLDLAGRRVAVAVNAEVVPRSNLAQVEIRTGDRVEVIHAVGGG